MTTRFALFFLLLLTCSVAVGQVHRSDSGLGGALILPYWTAANDNDTLLSIRNDSDDASAAKVRILDDEGVLLRSFNLYLDAGAVWTSGVAWFDGVPKLLLKDIGCMLPLDIASDTEFQLPAIALDAPRGSVEIIEMARATDGSEWVDSGQWADCDVLAEAFDSGAWSDTPNAGLEPPAQRLSATAGIINVPLGGMNAVAATALGGFSDMAQHSAPDDSTPDLSHAFDSEAPEGGTRSLVCTSTGCRTDEWNLPIQAVAAALTVSSMRVDYSVAQSVVARFDWMIHRPLERYESEQGGFVIDAAPTLTVRNRRGVSNDHGPVCITPPPWFPACGESAFPLDRGLVHQNLAFNAGSEDDGGLLESAVLGHPTIVRPAFVLGDSHSAEFHEGSAEFRFDTSDDDVELLVASDGTAYAGEPVISFAVQQYTNGTLFDRFGQAVLANYRATERPRQILRLESPD